MCAAKLVTIMVPFLAPGLCNTASHFMSVGLNRRNSQGRYRKVGRYLENCEQNLFTVGSGEK